MITGWTYLVITDARAEEFETELRFHQPGVYRTHDMTIPADVHDHLCFRHPELIVLLVPQGAQRSLPDEIRTFRRLPKL